MPDPRRVEFVTIHFRDLQTIRFAPVPAVMLLGPIASHWMPHVSPGIARGMLLGFLLSVAGFYWWSTVAIRQRYGSVRLSTDEALRMRFHPIIFALSVIMVAVQSWFYFFDGRNYHWEVYTIFTVLITMLIPVLDSTNPPGRRIAWAIGFMVLFTGVPFLLGPGGGDVELAGAVWLSLSIFDFLLLRRTFDVIGNRG